MPPKKFPHDMQPLRLDSNVTFDSIGGLEEHIKCLREMVLLPLVYPDFFKRYHTRPPKGVLFHGQPGTGKTLLARALANECASMRGKKVSFFMRKGADVMSKWYGESEKSLKMLFSTASKMKPSIIFFDEIDALAPSRSEGYSEVYTSVTATLLVEMDGLWDRGDVIVIGATNRPESLDPALRRPGRFDRELFFPPPSVLGRRDILNIYTHHWMPRPTDAMLDYMAKITNGYLGSDLYAICSEAVLSALRRVYPQVCEGDRHSSIDTRVIEVTIDDLLAAKRKITPAGGRSTPMPAKQLPALCEPLMQAQVDSAYALLKQAFPCSEESLTDVVSPSVFLMSGECSETHIAPALLAQLDHCALQELSMATLHSTQALSMERAVMSIFSECRNSERSCVIFMPNVAAVWEALENSASQALFMQLWRTRAGGDNVLLLATSNEYHNELPKELQALFPLYKNCMYRIRDPTPVETLNFLMPIINDLPTPLPNTENAASANTVVSATEPQLTNEEGEACSSEAYYENITSAPRKRKHTDHHHSEYKRLKHRDEKHDGIEEKKDVKLVDLPKLLRANAEHLSHLGLYMLTDLHSQLTKAVRACATSRNYNQVPQDMQSIISRYLRLVRK